MEIVVKIVALLAVCLVSFSLYVFLISEILPKYFLKLSYDFKNDLGRGLKKFVYPEGRAVVYEPHPSVRKYISKYALFTLDGYKYISIRSEKGVKMYTARMITFDKNNKVINIVDIEQKLDGGNHESIIRIHDKTSYVAFMVMSVNGDAQPVHTYASMRLKDMPGYFIVIFSITFAEFIHIISTIMEIAKLVESPIPLYSGYQFFVLPSLVVGAVCAMLTLLIRVKKGVKVVFK